MQSELMKNLTCAMALSVCGLNSVAQQPADQNTFPNSIYVAESVDSLIDGERQTESVAPISDSSTSTPVFTQADVERIVDEALRRKSAEEAKAKEEIEKAEKAQSELAGYQVGTDLGMTAKWNNGLELSTKNKDFRVHIGGRYQFDTGWFSVDPAVQNNINVPYRDGVDFRRARFRIDGTMYETLEWATEIDFVNAQVERNQPTSLAAPGFNEFTVVALTDFWWTFKEVPLFGNVRIGQQKEPIGFEHIQSSRFLPFMERSFNQDSFYGGTYNGFTPGIQFFRNYGADQKGVIQAGLFKPASNFFGYGIGDGDYSIVTRMTHLMWYENEGTQLLHLAVSAKQATAVGQQGLPNRVQTFRTRDAVRTGLAGDWSVPAGISLYGDDMQWLNSEFVAVNGSWTFQSEYLVSNLREARTVLADPGVNAVYHGGYVQLMKFLTGENDQYSRTTGVFERVTPTENFFLVRDRCGNRASGMGAWQVGARYNYLDLNDKSLNGGELHNITSGLNWFWNPNTKWQFNYIATYRDVTDVAAVADGSGWIHGFGTRIACDF
jgi:phosphate-selective porin OprO and OprP